METLLLGRKTPNVSTEALSVFGQQSKQRAMEWGQNATDSLSQMPTAGYMGQAPTAENRPEARPAEAWWNQAPGVGTPKMSDDMSQYGFADNVPRSLIGTESGGNWSAKNNETGSGGKSGHYGILQFGHDRFSEAQKAGAVPAGMSIQDFGSDTPQGRAAQVAASNWHFSDIDRRIVANGYDRMIGQNVGGVVMSWDGMRSMAHLGGFGGLSSYIKSNGSYNPADSFGTSLAAYGTKHQSS